MSGVVELAGPDTGLRPQRIAQAVSVTSTPKELHDLAATKPEVVKQLQDELDALKLCDKIAPF